MLYKIWLLIDGRWQYSGVQKFHWIHQFKKDETFEWANKNYLIDNVKDSGEIIDLYLIEYVDSNGKMNSNLEINLENLKNDLWSWYYEEYGRGKLDTLKLEDARILYDSMAVLNYLMEQDIRVIKTDRLNRP
jgi:hypothetical protein